MMKKNKEKSVQRFPYEIKKKLKGSEPIWNRALRGMLSYYKNLRKIKSDPLVVLLSWGRNKNKNIDGGLKYLEYEALKEKADTIRMIPLAEAALEAARVIDNLKADIVLVPERGATPLGKMVAIALDKLRKNGEVKVRPYFIYYPSSGQHKYDIAEHAGVKIHNLVESDKIFRELGISLRNLGVENIKNIVIIDEVNSGVSFYLTYLLAQTSLRNFLRKQGIAKIRIHGIGFASHSGRNLTTSKTKIRRAIDKQAKDLRNLQKNVKKDFKDFVSRLVSRHNLYSKSFLNKLLDKLKDESVKLRIETLLYEQPINPKHRKKELVNILVDVLPKHPELAYLIGEAREEVLAEKIAKKNRSLRYLRNIEEAREDLRTSVETLWKVAKDYPFIQKRIFSTIANIETAKPYLLEFLEYLDLKSLKKKKYLHTPGYGQIHIIPLDMALLDSKEKAEDVGEVFVAPTLKAHIKGKYIVEDETPTPDIIWSPKYLKRVKYIRRIFYNALKQVMQGIKIRTQLFPDFEKKKNPWLELLRMLPEQKRKRNKS